MKVKDSYITEHPAHSTVEPPHGWGPVVLVVVVLSGLTISCGGAAEPQRTPDAGPSAGSQTVISGPCATPPSIDVPEPAGSESWSPVTVAPPETCFKMQAERADATGVLPDTAFLLESVVRLEPQEVQALLLTDPPLEFEVEGEPVPAVASAGLDSGPRADEISKESWSAAAQAAEQEQALKYRIQPTSPLEPGQLVRFTLVDAPQDGQALASWTFQARQPLRVVQTLPGDAASDVPLDAAIELTFSHAGVTGVEDHFRIEPAVGGRFETHNRTTVFVPEGLEPGTLYTVRLEPGVGVDGSDLHLEEPYELRFETGAEVREEPEGGVTLVSSRQLWEQQTDQAPVVSVISYRGPEEVAGAMAEVKALRYSDREAFVTALEGLAEIPQWARATRERYEPDVDGLEEAALFEAPLEPLGRYGELVVRFPQPLDAGAYLVLIEVDDQAVQTWLEVTDVATYVALSDTSTLVWVNDAASGGPLSGAQVAVDGVVLGSTDERGLLSVETPVRLRESSAEQNGGADEPLGMLLATAPDGRWAVAPMAEAFRSYAAGGYYEMPGAGDSRYWRYVYSDRWLYRLRDEIRLWGVVRGRDGHETPDEVVLELGGGGYIGADHEPAVLARTTTALGPTGTFTGLLSFEGASPGYYTLRTIVDGEVIGTESVEIRDFAKPAYGIEVQPSSKAVIVGDEITLTIRAAFFEGSPVPGVDLEVSGDAETVVTTDEAGEASVTYEATAPAGGEGWSVTRSYVDVRPAVPEEGDIGSGVSVIVFPGLAALELRSDAVEDRGVISGTVRALDVSRQDAVEQRDFLAEALPDRAVRAEVTEVSYDKVETGEHYDFIDKVVRKSYRYERVERPGGVLETRSDQEGRFSFELQLAEDRTYEVDVSVADDAGRVTTQRVYLGRRPGGAPLEETTLVSERPGPYAEGDQVSLVLQRGGQPLPDGDAFLFLQARGGIHDFVLQQSPRFSFTFGPEHVPNVHVLAVSFNGATYLEAPWSYNAIFDNETRELTIEVASDRERYAPGDEVKLAVSVTRPDGQPVEAEVMLSAVDAALVELQGYLPGDSFLSELYASVPSGVQSTYASHQMPLGSAGAEGGGGGDGPGVRSDFEDVALFTTVHTDTLGRAEASFTTPDNLTSWVVRALGITDDLSAGAAKGAVPVGLPLFVDLTANRTYLVSDEPVLRLRAFGEALQPGQPVSFELYAETLTAEPLKVEGVAFEPVDFALPPLSDGEHTIGARVTSGDLEDVLERPLTVVRSRFSVQRSEVALVAAGEAYSPPPDVRRRVSLVVSDASRGQYIEDLARLSSTFSDRLDALVSREVARELEATYFGPQLTDATGAVTEDDPLAQYDPMSASHDLEPYVADDGGLALLPYGDAELMLSARVAAVAPNSVGRQALEEYFTAVLDDPDETRERVSVALHGLAALGSPVLPAVQRMLREPDLSPREELYLALASAMLGDLGSADGVYRSLTARYAQQRGATTRLNVGPDRDAVLEATALAAVLASQLRDALAPSLYAYTTANRAEDIVLNLDQVDYLSRALPVMAESSLRVSYTHLGEAEDVLVEPGQNLLLDLTPEQLDELQLQVLEGNAAVALTTLQPLDTSAMETDPSVALSRSFSVVQPAQESAEGAGSQETIELAADDLVRVRLDYLLGPEAEDGCYQLTDILPSGLVPVSQPRSAFGYYYPDQDIVYPYAVAGQRVSFCVYRSDQDKTLSYLARVITKGRYVAEPALIEAMTAPESRAMSASALVEIR